jgi:hypothetical protein
MTKHTGHAPILVDHLAELPVAQTRNQRPHPLELTRIRRNEGAIHNDQTNRHSIGFQACRKSVTSLYRAIGSPYARLSIADLNAGAASTTRPTAISAKRAVEDHLF